MDVADRGILFVPEKPRTKAQELDEEEDKKEQLRKDIEKHMTASTRQSWGKLQEIQKEKSVEKK